MCGRFLVLSVLLATTSLAAADDKSDVVKVFVLAGQSNMEGKAPNALLEHQARDAKTKELFAHLRQDDQWIVRDDVFIKFLDRHGPLTIGYGSPDRTGCELELGTVLGNHFEEPVMLIKAAWGGHSLVKNFRPPSAGLPNDEKLNEELKQAQDRVTKNNEKNNKNDPLPTLEDIKTPYGSSYRHMLAEVADVEAGCETLFPPLKGKRPELAGFVWFQGWNDQYGGQDEYESNLKHLIRDVRRDLKSPHLPVVIAAMGQNGSKPATGAMLTVQQAQLAMNDVPEFRGNVKTIRTDELVDKAAEELYPHWKERFEEWKLTGGDHAYHYLGSAIWFNRIGKKLGETMVELLKQ
jgi:alpha-galactosidase